MRITSTCIVFLAAVPCGAQDLTPNGKLLRPGVDSLAVFFINGTDTARTGLVRDELEFVEVNGRQVLRRVYQTRDRVLGIRVDTLVDDAIDLRPVAHRSRTLNGFEFLEFAKGRATGWMRLANGDSVTVDAPLDPSAYNSSTFDLVLRSAPLHTSWKVQIPSFMANTRTVVPLSARVVGSELIDGEETWKVQADFTGMPVTFWIGKESRRLRRQLMQLRPDRGILFASPSSKVSRSAT
jgi:hypothetical protein